MSLDYDPQAWTEQKIKELKLERQTASVRAGQLQEELNKTIVAVHQLDGAIGVLEIALKNGLAHVPTVE